MSEENVEVVRKAIDAFNAFMRGEDTSEANAELINAELVDPQVEFEFQWHDQRTFPDEPQHLRGWPEFIGWCEDVREAWDELSIEALEFIEAPPDRVRTPVLERGRGRESGVPHETHFFEVWTLRDGKVRKVVLFRHHADALEAAGLRE